LSGLFAIFVWNSSMLRPLCVLFVFGGAAPLRAAVLWTEAAESTANVTTNASGYSLVQSDVAAQGSSAFHLAHPTPTASQFVRITPALTIQADTKLFFQSRLGWATPQQVARVEASSDGGVNWPISLYTQAGTGGVGEGGFSLKQIDLAPYASQSLVFRFNYTFTSSKFPQSDAGVGWYVDDIQFADQLQKSLYSIGNPSNHEQLYLEYINRARADAIVEANRLKNENAPGVPTAYSFFGISGENIVNQFTTSVANGYLDQHAQPLSFNAALLQASELHSQDLLAHNDQSHASSSNPPAPFGPGYNPSQRAQAFGYSGGVAENVYSYNKSVAEGHAGFDVDWGNVSNSGDPNYNPSFAGQGMQNPAGHRRNIHNGDYNEIGVGFIEGVGVGPDPVGPYLVTQNFGSSGAPIVTGVVYQDLNANNFYDIGEGRSGVRVDVEGSAFYAISTASGGYSVPAAGDGEFDVSFTGGGFASFATTATVTGGLNVKIDYRTMSAVTYAADFNNDTRVNAADYLKWRTDFGLGAGSDADDDGDSDGNDFLVWQRQLGSGVTSQLVPEPAAATLMVMLAAALAGSRRGRKNSPRETGA
jgi:uncharacterized protein YkwD